MTIVTNVSMHIIYFGQMRVPIKPSAIWTGFLYVAVSVKYHAFYHKIYASDLRAWHQSNADAVLTRDVRKRRIFDLAGHVVISV